ncbi:MAG: hypothetical protein QQN41_09100 [Nitrosopumilus sp.]
MLALKLNLLKIELHTVISYFWLVLISAFSVWIRNRIKRAEKNMSEIHYMKRKALQQMIDLHSKLASGKSYDNNWIDEFGEMRKEIVVWAPDNVLIEYTKYNEKRDPDCMKNIKDYEVYFSKAIIAYRKEFGCKNKGNRLKPEHISAIFKSTNTSR